jgi:gamma-glutamyltranspeptidase/glutathione hydrolase
VAAPRIHHQDLPDVLFVEPDGLRDEIQESLKARGFTLKSRGVIANSPAIVRAKDGGWSAYADPRRGGGAEGN